jgi:tetratricopeptide (TPR) repeat protein
MASLAGLRAVAPQTADAPTRREWAAITAIVAAALALRLWNLQQLAAQDPFFDRPSVDERMYHEWAQSIARGEGLGARALLNGPAYPCFLALVYSLFGPSLFAAKALQSALGAVDCALVFGLGRRLVGGPAALIAAAMLALYELAIFYPATLMLEGAQGTLLLAMLWLCVRAQERERASLWLGAGGATGVAALARPTALLFAAALTAWAALRPGVAPRTRALAALAFAAGVATGVAPATWHNARAAGDFVLVSYAGGMNLYIGNNPDARGEFGVPRIVPSALADDPEEQRAVFAALAEQASGRALAPSEVSAFWTRRALDYVREQPGAWLRLMARKLALSFNAYEPWNVRSLTLARDASAVLRLPLLGFGAVAPFAVLGLWATRGSWRRLLPLYAWLATVWLSLWIFFVLARYRMAALPVLLIFAGAGVVAAWDALRAREPRRLAAVGLALALLSLGARWPIAQENLGVAYFNLANRHRERGEPERAIEAYAESLQRAPGYLSAWNNLARSYEDLGRRDEAREAWRVLLSLAQAQGSALHEERARRHLEALEAPAPPDPPR